MKMKKVLLAPALFLVCLCLICAFADAAWAAPVTETVTVPAGQTTFSVDLNVNEAAPYAGIEFALTVSDEGASSFASFTPALNGASASPFVTKDGKHYFGFLAGSNAFAAGTNRVGALYFTGYTGDGPLTITIAQMNVIRLDENKHSVTSSKEPPVAVITVGRATGGDTGDGTNPGTGTGGGDNPGTGTGGTGGGNPGTGASGATTVTIGEDATPLADVDQLPFEDVHAPDWFYGDVAYAYTRGLMNGVSATLFSPGASLTRGMLVTVLYRQAGSSDVTGLSIPFRDVPLNAWYTDAVKWAEKNGVVYGVGDDRFEPDAPVTRQDLAAVLLRYADHANLRLPAVKAYQDFKDEADIAAYAKEAVKALFEAGVINGKPGDLFDPKGTATRAEVAAMLHRFLEIER